MRLEGLGQLENPMTSSGIEPATFRFVAYCLDQLRYRVNLEYMECESEALPLAPIRSVAVCVQLISSSHYMSHGRQYITVDPIPSGTV
jgi:hypothetical protein